jgi:phosphoglucosamine mutase
MYLCGKHMRENGQLDHDMIVTTVMTNLGFYKTCDANGLKYQQTAVGDKYVAENMMANGYVLGGEQSGHIIFGKYATTGDGILTSLMVMQTMLEKKMPLAMMADEMRIYPQVLKNIKVHSKEKTLANEKVKAAVKAAKEGLGNAGRILVRESGTEPKIRVMVEADTTQECEKWVDSVIDVIRAEGLALS